MKLVIDEKGTLRGVTVMAILGFSPKVIRRGRITPPPPTPKRPDTKPAKAPIPIRTAIGNFSFSLNFFIGKIVVKATENRNNVKAKPTTLLGIESEAYAPTGEKMTEDKTIGKAIFGSNSPL
jgi:hypothetical protein